MPRLRRSEDFYQLRNEGAGEGSAGDNRSQFPPLRGVVAQAWNDNGDDTTNPFGPPKFLQKGASQKAQK